MIFLIYLIKLKCLLGNMISLTHLLVREYHFYRILFIFFLGLFTVNAKALRTHALLMIKQIWTLFLPISYICIFTFKWVLQLPIIFSSLKCDNWRLQSLYPTFIKRKSFLNHLSAAMTFVIYKCVVDHLTRN